MKVIYAGGEGEIIEKKSRFIATVRPVAGEDEAAAFIAEMKKKYWDARHNCSAFVVKQLARCSDDGEPPQTAGHPMLDVLLGEDLHDVAVVVTRYFGGVLLGTGGLVRAYQAAVHAGLDACVIADLQSGRPLTVATDYSGLGKLQYLFAQRGLATMDAEYADQVRLTVMAPSGECEAIEREVAEASGGAAGILWGSETDYVVVDGRVELRSW